MRKADYVTLAAIIARRLRELRSQGTAAADLAAQHIEALAREFAASANVDRGLFLKACSLT